MDRILGAIPRKLDVRDIMLGSVQAQIQTEIPSVFKPAVIDQYIKEYQNGQPACGAHAGDIFKVIQETYEDAKPKRFSPRFLWHAIKKLINNGAGDGFDLEQGTDMRSIFKALKSFGICDFDLVGNDVSLSLEAYSTPEISQEVLDNAQIKIIDAYAFLNDLSFNSLKRAIYLNKAVLTLIRCDDGFFGTKTPTFTERKYGHFVVLVGYEENGIYFIDSTEQDFSNSVKFMDIKYLNFIIEAGTAVDLPNEKVKALVDKKRTLQTVVSVLQKISGLWLYASNEQKGLFANLIKAILAEINK